MAFRGETDRAFDWLDKAVTYRASGLSGVSTNALFVNIQSDPRWKPFLKLVGKAPEQLAVVEFNVSIPD